MLVFHSIFTYLGSNLVFNEIEYFIYLNLWLILLLFILFYLFIIINSSALFISSIYFTNSIIELIITLFCIIYLLLIISPALILLLDYDIVLIPSFIIYTIGYQWAWSLNIYLNNTLSTYVDHYLIHLKILTSKQGRFIDEVFINSISFKNSFSSLIIKKQIIILINNESIIIPIYSLIKLLIMSYDVIHSIGFYSFGIKMDAIPAKINLSQSIRPIKKGQYRGFCFELCGQGHASMLLTSWNIFILVNLIDCDGIIWLNSRWKP